MRLVSWFTAATIFCAFSFSARAELITTFTLTHGTDTIQWSITPSTIPSNVQLTAPLWFGYHEPLTINGVTQYAGVPGDDPSEGVESLQPLGVGAEFYVGYAEGVINGMYHIHYLFEQGPQIFTLVNGLPTFTPETIVFPQVGISDSIGSSSTLQWGSGDTLVISQSDTVPAATPEPSSFALLGTGLLGFAGAIRRRLA